MNNQFFNGMSLGPLQGPQLGPMQNTSIRPLQPPNGMCNPVSGPSTTSSSQSAYGDPAHNNLPLQFKNSQSGFATSENEPARGSASATYSSSFTMTTSQQPSVVASSSVMIGPVGPGQGGPDPGPSGLRPSGSGPSGLGPSGSGPPGPGLSGPGPMMMGPWGNMMGPMGMDPSMMMWGPWGMGGMMEGGMVPPPPPQPLREIIRLKSAVLYPPPPNSRPQTTRERPLGCRTAFIGGVPDNINEDILRELFESCGTICSVRVSKKNFAHVRFEQQDSVERALFYSGYRIKIDDKEEKENTGRLHVDYAQARDDQHEYEMWQRAVAREARHMERLHAELMRPPSPPKPIHYSDHEALTLIDSMKSDEKFAESIQTLIAWLERGDCSKRTSGMFYSLIQSSNVHIRHLMTEKSNYSDELEQMKIKYHQRLEAIINQLEHIERVFTSASKQKSWDHFTKAQRKNIEMWRRQLQTLKAKQMSEFMENCGEADMDLSDTEDQVIEAKRRKVKPPPETIDLDVEPDDDDSCSGQAQDENQLCSENSILKCQLEAYKNEVDLVKAESRVTDEAKDKQIKDLQFALQGMQQQLVNSTQTIRKTEDSLKQVQVENKSLKQQLISKTAAAAGGGGGGGLSDTDTDTSVSVDGESCHTDVSLAVDDVISTLQTSKSVTSRTSELTTDSTLSHREARLISVVSTFLLVHPSGASIDYIWSYLNRLQLKIRSCELEDLLEQYPSIFDCSRPTDQLDTSHEKKWMFVAYTEPNVS